MDEQKTTGTLYIVATPIGNSRDMSERGREILSTADIIAAEDTRRSVVLLNKLGIRGNSLSANHKFNEYGKAKWFIEQLASGKDIAVITDAGTPCISDPGNELIRAAVENGIRVVGVPGCCAAVNALSISGFDLSTFFFYGFFPRETADRRRVLMMMRKGDTATYAFYESPKRIMSVIDFFIEENAQLRLCLCNDMTKLHEMTFRGTPQEVKDQLIAKETYEKGEYALIFYVLLVLLQKLVGEVAVRFRAAGGAVVVVDGLAVARRFGKTHVARDDGRIHLAGEVALDLLGDLHGEVGAPVEHRQQHALQLQPRIHAAAHDAHGVHQIGKALERVILALHGHE